MFEREMKEEKQKRVIEP